MLMGWAKFNDLKHDEASYWLIWMEEEEVWHGVAYILCFNLSKITQ